MQTRPTTDRGRATVARVLDAACELFARQGVRATTLNQIGAAAGVGRGQLYHFYADKSDLVADVVAQQVERVIGAMRPHLEALGSGDDVRAWCAGTVALHAEGGPVRCPMGSLVHELTDTDPRAKAALADGFGRLRATFETGFARVADRGGLAAGVDPATLATGVLAAYQGGILLAEATGDAEALRRALDAVVGPALSVQERVP